MPCTRAAAACWRCSSESSLILRFDARDVSPARSGTESQRASERGAARDAAVASSDRQLQGGDALGAWNCSNGRRLRLSARGWSRRQHGLQ